MQRGRAAVSVAVLAALWVAACAPAAPQPPRPDLSGAVRGEPPPEGAPGCWHRDEAPAVFETRTEARILGDGRVERVQVQVKVRPRATIWFEVPCGAPSAAFVASLQRALKARGLFDLPVTGVADAPTAAAVRRFQEPRGIASGTLSRAAGEALGLVAVAP